MLHCFCSCSFLNQDCNLCLCKERRKTKKTKTNKLYQNYRELLGCSADLGCATASTVPALALRATKQSCSGLGGRLWHEGRACPARLGQELLSWALVVLPCSCPSSRDQRQAHTKATSGPQTATRDKRGKGRGVGHQAEGLGMKPGRGQSTAPAAPPGARAVSNPHSAVCQKGWAEQKPW